MRMTSAVRFTWVALSCLVLSVALAARAEAKIHIPCTGDRLVKVAEVPAARQPPGQVIHLGYLFPGCFSEGEWIGFSNESGKYYKLNDAQRADLVRRAGLRALPPTPSRWSYPFDALLIELITMGVLALVLGWELIKALRRKKPEASA